MAICLPDRQLLLNFKCKLAVYMKAICLFDYALTSFKCCSAAIPAGNSVCALLYGFEPYFYVEAPTTATPEDCHLLRQILNVSIPNSNSVPLSNEMSVKFPPKH